MEVLNDARKDQDPVVETEEFDWTAFLEVSGDGEATPESAFCHVEASMDSGVKEGMIVEKPLDSTAKVFWLASIDSVFGPLLKLSWLGDENLEEIWHDLNKEKIYPLGFCQMNKIKLEPPPKVAETCPLWQTLALEYLEDATFDTVAMHFLDDDGITPIERLKPGMGVHVNDQEKPYDAKILANHGGLLHVQDVLDENSQEYIFYSNPKLNQMTDVKRHGLKKPPNDLISKLIDAKKTLFSRNEALEVIVNGKAHIAHANDTSTITLNGHTFLPHDFALAPVGTFINEFKGKNIAPKEKFAAFDSAEELGFLPKQKLMICIKKNEFHPSTILKCTSHFVVLIIDTLGQEYIASVHDPTLFPLSWCQNYGLKFYIYQSYKGILEESSDGGQSATITEDPVQNQPRKTQTSDQDGSWCPPIFFNYKCYSASFLSRARLAGLPKKVGPGPVQLVMREVLNLIIGSSFKSGSVLKRLEAKTDQASSDFVIEELKGKSRVLNLKGRIEIPTKASQVDKFLREMCQKLSACPNLVSTVVYDDVCPTDCHNRPKADFKEEDGQHNNAKSDRIATRRKGKKRRHPDAVLVENSKNSTNASSSDESETSSSRPTSPLQRKKRSKEWGTILPKSEIRTRGAKLPNFSLHLKIRPSRKEQRAIESSNFRNNMSYSDNLLSKSGGKKGRRELPPAFSMQDFPKAPPPIRRIRLENNPEDWTPQDTARFLSQTSDCAHLARFAVEDDIDGPAFMLLNYPTVKEYWKLKTSTAISLCRHIESVVLAHRLSY